MDRINIIAIDLIDTLIQRGRDQFTSRGLGILKQYNVNITETKFSSVFRKRYLEYSMGNYNNDIAFMKAVFIEYPHVDIDEISERIMEVRYECSPPFPEATMFLEKASKHFKLVLASNYVLSWAEHTVKKNNWKRYFANLVVSSDCGFRKPSVEFFNCLIQKSNAQSSSEILLVGDSVANDVYGAVNAGINVVLLDRSGNAKSNLYNTKTINELGELFNILRI